MSEIMNKIENQILDLPREKRAFLADRLLSSLDGEVLTDIDAAWVAEADRRYQKYKEDKRQGVNADIVFKEADQILK
ncbi:MAG: addiction module protein [Deltaproteobacteria bacterium]|jgi:putative addiction module component (TIGR02574 family)|nr:addiction module protein [Deltaproteobacteria bacterium]MBT4527010.1 addiction module protein [Deltaproteobacteria bacterium]